MFIEKKRRDNNNFEIVGVIEYLGRLCLMLWRDKAGSAESNLRVNRGNLGIFLFLWLLVSTENLEEGA